MASPGLELLIALVSPDISQPQDALVCFIHWELISRGFRCLGNGEKAGADEKKSEQLPKGWTSNNELYTLRYEDSKSKILLKALTVDGTLIVNVMINHGLDEGEPSQWNVWYPDAIVFIAAQHGSQLHDQRANDMQTEKVNNLTLTVGDFVDGAHLKDFPRMFKKEKELKRKLETELMSPLLCPKETSGKLEKEKGEKPPEYFMPRMPAGSAPLVDPSVNVPYGGADLDPLGRQSGGMYFDPFRSETRPRPDPLFGLPPGSVPPDARFDPFGPPGAGRPGPDPDHEKPPGYDDMFM